MYAPSVETENQKGISISHRTLQLLKDYIQRHSIDGKLRRPISEIAEDIQMSNATVSRALKRLEEENAIRILPPNRPSEPNTILWIGPVNEVEQVHSGYKYLDQLEHLVTKDLKEYVRSMEHTISQLRQELEEWNEIKSRIVQRVDLSDGLHEVLLLRKEQKEERQ